MKGVREIAELEFQDEVVESALPVLVDFYAPWCGPCKALAPVLESFAADYEGRVKVIKVNVDDSPELAARHRIRGVPTMLFFKDGKVVDSVVGLTSLAVMRAKLNALTAGAVEPAGVR